MVMLCLFLAPVGVYMLGTRWMRNKRALIAGGMRLLILSAVFMLFFFMWIFDEAMVSNPFTYLFGLGGIGGLSMGAVMIRRGLRNRQYQAAIEKHHMWTARDIAAIVKRPEDVVVKDIMRMLADDFFADMKWDVKARAFRVDKVVMNAAVAECMRCGATVLVANGYGVCEYCGSAVGTDAPG